jgi:ferrous iron transport protein A
LGVREGRGAQRDLAHMAAPQETEIENDFQKCYVVSVVSLAEIPLGRRVTVRAVDGARAFRRRLLEMGLVPGTPVRVVTVAPLGDPLRIEVRGGQWSIRRAEAAQIQVEQK